MGKEFGGPAATDQISRGNSNSRILLMDNKEQLPVGKCNKKKSHSLFLSVCVGGGVIKVHKTVQI